MKQKIVTPTVPNFIKVEVGKESVMLSVAEFSEEELKKIGEEWTQDLITKSKRLKQNTY